MKKEIEDLEFERSRMEILKMTGKNVSEYQTSSKKRAWEYEIEEYRKRKKLNKFLIFGAICGIVSLILTLTLNYTKLLEILLNH